MTPKRSMTELKVKWPSLRIDAQGFQFPIPGLTSHVWLQDPQHRTKSFRVRVYQGDGKWSEWERMTGEELFRRVVTVAPGTGSPSDRDARRRSEEITTTTLPTNCPYQDVIADYQDSVRLFQAEIAKDGDCSIPCPECHPEVVANLRQLCRERVAGNREALRDAQEGLRNAQLKCDGLRR